MPEMLGSRASRNPKFTDARWCWLLYFLLVCPVKASKRPNFVIILTDDQDLHMGSMDFMPNVQKYIQESGAVYQNHYCSTSICCPARATLWTGKAAHNTNLTDVIPPYGGYSKFVQEGYNQDYLPIWLQDAGYNTFYAGKLFNGIDANSYNAPYPGGFNSSNILLGPYIYDYQNPAMTHDLQEPVYYSAKYSTDLIAERGMALLKEATQHDDPFFVTVAPIAPHVAMTLKPLEFHMPQPADRHAGLFSQYKIPRDASFNPRKNDGPSWLGKVPLLDQKKIAYGDELQRARLQSLQAVDEMVKDIVEFLWNEGKLQDTYIFYTTDNGYHIGQHRIAAGKQLGYEGDVHIPLVIRGPSIAPQTKINAITTHTDLAPTILSLAGVYRNDLDGSPIPLAPDSAGYRSDHAAIEYWGYYIEEVSPDYEPETDYPITRLNNTYKAVRMIGDGYNLYYAVWCTGEKEYYNMRVDPGQVDNLILHPSRAARHRVAGRRIEHVINRLDALTRVLRYCKAIECVSPWKILHPWGDVSNLREALKPMYDKFYAEQPKIMFKACGLGFLKEDEGEQVVELPTENPEEDGDGDTDGWGRDVRGDENEKSGTFLQLLQVWMQAFAYVDFPL